MRFDDVRLGTKYLCACLLEVMPQQMSLCKCQFIKVMPISLVLDSRWTHQLGLKLVLSYQMQGSDEKYVQIDRLVLWAICPLSFHSEEGHPICMQSWRDVPWT